MSLSGKKHLTYYERKQLFRKTPRIVNSYQNDTILEYKQLIESFTRDDYQLYEKILHSYRNVKSMLDYCVSNNIVGPVLELAKIRETNLKTYQKLIQILRHRWTDLWEITQHKRNEDPEKFWLQMSGRIQGRSVSNKIKLYKEWQGEEGRKKLIAFLKDLFIKQDGKCALSKEAMTLTSGIGFTNYNKCSPDRKDSNKGYTPENLWFVTWWVNNMKMDTPPEVFLKRVSILAEAQSNKLNNYDNN